MDDQGFGGGSLGERVSGSNHGPRGSGGCGLPGEWIFPSWHGLLVFGRSRPGPCKWRWSLETIDWGEFERVELRVGTVLEVLPFPEARKPAYKLKIDFGTGIGERKSSAQITNNYPAEGLLGRQVVAVVNFPRKQIGPFMSECLVAGFYREDGTVVLAVPDQPVPNGAKLG